jgi:hypothetical protein
MVIYNFYLFRAFRTFRPFKADPPLDVYSDAVLTCSVAFHTFQGRSDLILTSLFLLLCSATFNIAHLTIQRTFDLLPESVITQRIVIVG